MGAKDVVAAAISSERNSVVSVSAPARAGAKDAAAATVSPERNSEVFASASSQKRAENADTPTAPPKRNPTTSAPAPFSEGGAAYGGGGCPPRVYNVKLHPVAQSLRRNATPQENHLWFDFLREFRPRFTRQRIIGNFIIDFYCPKALLAVEVDGSQHYSEAGIERDEERTAFLESLYIMVLRFTNHAVDKSFTAVCDKITLTVRERENLIRSNDIIVENPTIIHRKV
jgi:very-short-patch-repair endonuclease